MNDSEPSGNSGAAFPPPKAPMTCRRRFPHPPHDTARADVGDFRCVGIEGRVRPPDADHLTAGKLETYFRESAASARLAASAEEDRNSIAAAALRGKAVAFTEAAVHVHRLVGLILEV